MPMEGERWVQEPEQQSPAKAQPSTSCFIATRSGEPWEKAERTGGKRGFTAICLAHCMDVRAG